MKLFGKQIQFSVLLNVVFSAILLTSILSACLGNQTDVSNANATTAAQKWGAGPKITNFYQYQQELEIYEALDNPNLVLNVYTQSNDGSLRCLGKVKGYGVPYGTQQSPPTDASGKPVPEPNGLYPSQNTNADWIRLIQPNGSTKLAFAEPSLIITDAELPCKPLDK
jgi:hypothetical protein